MFSFESLPFPMTWVTLIGHFTTEQETQLSLTNRATRLEVSQGQQRWYHSIRFLLVCYSNVGVGLVAWELSSPVTVVRTLVLGANQAATRPRSTTSDRCKKEVQWAPQAPYWFLERHQKGIPSGKLRASWSCEASMAVVGPPPSACPWS